MSPTPPWPWRWLLRDALPAAVAAAGAVLVLALAVRAAGAEPPLALLVAAVSLVAYTWKLVAVVRANRTVQPSAPNRIRRGVARGLGSALVRAVAGAGLLLLIGLDTATALPLGLAVSVAVGYIQLARQVAIIETFRDMDVAL